MTNTAHAPSQHLRRLQDAHAAGGREAALEAFIDLTSDEMTAEERTAGAALPLVAWLKSENAR
jgi:hypothetical protein